MAKNRAAHPRTVDLIVEHSGVDRIEFLSPDEYAASEGGEGIEAKLFAGVADGSSWLVAWGSPAAATERSRCVSVMELNLSDAPTPGKLIPGVRASYDRPGCSESRGPLSEILSWPSPVKSAAWAGIGLR